MALGSWQKHRIGWFVFSACCLFLITEVVTAQPNQTFNAGSSIQHLQQLLVTTASQAAGALSRSCSFASDRLMTSPDPPDDVSIFGLPHLQAGTIKVWRLPSMRLLHLRMSRRVSL